MIVYIDLLIIINFLFDFCLLSTINIALKRYAKIKRLFIGSIFGELTLVSLFLPLPSYMFTILKFLLAIFMVVVAFGYKNIKYTFYNVLYLYMLSVILGGFIYYLNIEFSISYSLVLIIAPFILYIFKKSINVLKEVKNYYYKVEIVFDEVKIVVTGFLDTGNKLVDPVTNKSIILVNKKKMKSCIHIRSPMYVAYNALNYHGLLSCYKPDYILVNSKKLDNYLVGISEENFKLNGVDCLLNYKIWEDI